MERGSFLALRLTVGVSFSKGLRGSTYRNTPTLMLATALQLRTETLIDDTLC